MPSPSATPTPITPPRVPLIDQRTGLIDRAWYMFFLSLFGAAQTALDNQDLGPSTESLVASFEEALARITQELQTQPVSTVEQIQPLLESIAQRLDTLPSVPQLGTIASLNTDNVPFIGFSNNPSPAIPNPAPNGTLYWDGGTTLNLQMTQNVILRLGEGQFIYVKASSAITKGQVCYHTGSVGASGVITVAPSPLALVDPNQIVGVAAESIALNGFGLIQISGTLRGFNTTGSSVGEVWADGDPLYYNPAYVGSFTNVKPSAPNQKTYLGEVINASSGGSGSISIRMVPGSVLGGTDSNVQITSVANKDLLQYDSALGYWKNVPATTAAVTSFSAGTTGLTPNTATTGAITLAGTLVVGNGGTGATTFTANGVVYGNTTSALGVTAAGTTGQVLVGNTGAAPSWASISTTAVTSISFGTTGLTPNAATTGAVTVAGTLVAANGGTGQSSYAVGDLLYASTTTALSKLADVATGNALISGGVGVAPSWGKIGLATHVSGTLPVANGGTGQTTYTDGQLLIGNTTGNTLTKATLTQGTGITITNGSGAITIANASPMTYPGAGIPNSTGSAWGTSYSTTGSGTVVALATSPVFTTPSLGVASATSINKVAITAPATSATLTIADGKTLTANNSITLAGTDSTTMTFPAASTTVAGLGTTQTFTGINTFTPAARTSGVASYFTLTTPADTGQTASTESIGANFTAGTRTWATGALTLQRERVFAAPTYAFAAASTLTTAVNVDIAAPVAGTNATITNSYALRAAASQFTGSVNVTGLTASTTVFTDANKNLTSTGTVAVANGGTGASSASITAFNNITGYTASGATGTTSTNLVFSTSPSLTTPALSGETFSTSATVTAGTNAQGQGALTNDYNIVTTTAANPSGVTLPTATTGRRVIVVNKGTNSINIYPATGATIDALAANAAIALPVNGYMEFNAASTTAWYSSYNLTVPAGAGGVSSISFGTTGLTPNTATTGAVSVAGTLATTNGGTGLTSFTANGAVYATSTSALTTGTLPVASGGTGLTAGTSGGIPYFSASNTLASSAALTANALVIGGGAGVAPSTTTTGAGILTFLGTPTSANLAAAVTDETGSGALVFATSPSLTTPSLGVATATSINKVTITAPATSATLTIADGKTLTANNSLTLAGTDATTMTFPSTSTTVAGLGITQTFTGVNTFTPTARTSGVASYFTLTTPADTGQTASTESIGANFTAGTRTWAAGALTLQRERVFAAPTYAFATASTLTTAVNVDIAAPVAGANATITNSYALRAAASQFTGSVNVTGLTASTTVFTDANKNLTSSGTVAVANGGTGLTAGTSGGVLYYSAANTLASSAALTANALVVGGGAGAAPSTITTGTGVTTALGVNTGTAGAFVVNGGALGTPSSGTVTNLTGTASININGTVGATTPAAGAFTTLSASSTVSGTGFSTYLASPPAIGGTVAAAGSFTTLTTSSTVTLNGGTANGVLYLNASNQATSGTALAFDGLNLSVGQTIKTGNLVSTGDAVIELGGDRTGSGNSYIDFHSVNATDFELRILRGGGANGKAQIVNTGTGDLEVQQSALGPITFLTNAAERMRITGAGNIVAGASAALSTAATDGFLYVPTCAGTPTGVPTTITGMAPIVVNTTNNKLYFYSGGAWRDAGP